jgi:hypothetical protein
MNPSRVEVTIDELILHGFARGDRHAIAEALQAELVRLLGEQGVPAAFAQGGQTDRVNTGNVEIAPGAAPQSIGVQIAGVVYGGPQS